MRTLFDELKSFSNVGFREIYHTFLYIHCRELLDAMFHSEIDDSITGVVAYCYIDETEGISFRAFMLGAMISDSLRVIDIPHSEDTMYILRLRDGQAYMSEAHHNGKNMYLYAVDPEKYKFFDLSVIDIDRDFAKDLKDDIDDIYFVNDGVEVLRTERYSYLDKYRHPTFPDDVETYLCSEENGIEKVWVRLKFITQEDSFFGILLKEPYKEQGCHENDLIEIEEYKTDKDSYLVFTGRVAVQDNQ